jgi:hypothetical protein
MPIYTPGKLVLARESVPFDNDAWEYIARVETADGQILEQSVRNAITNFVIGCKADGIWTAIKASCILAGARTLTGALVPLVGTAPTNNNFVSGDYNRTTGLVGDGSTKYLNVNRLNNAQPQDNRHQSVWLSASGPSTGVFIGSRTASNFDAILTASPGINGVLGRRVSSNCALVDIGVSNNPTGLHGTSRSASATFSSRVGSTTRSHSQTSETATTSSTYLFALSASVADTTPGNFTAARIAFYSIGESLDLALLDTRVTTLINAFAAAIP